MKKILVTGAGGFVGARILEMWRGRFELSAFPPDFLRTADETAVRRFITAERPDAIIHTAALSNTQVCQQHPEESPVIKAFPGGTLCKGRPAFLRSFGQRERTVWQKCTKVILMIWQNTKFSKRSVQNDKNTV